MSQLFANFVSTTLVDAIQATDRTIMATSTEGMPTLNTGDWFYLVLTTPTTPETIWEIVKVTNISDLSLSVDRGQDGTNAVAWPAKSRIEMRPIAQMLRDMVGSGLASVMATPPALGITVPNTIAGTVVTATGQFVGAGTGLTGVAANLTAGAANSVAWLNVALTPTTCAGYGIIDAITSDNIAAQSVASAAKLKTARNIMLSGDATGVTSFDGAANSVLVVTVVSAPKLTTARTISFAGAFTGSGSFDGTANVLITATLGDQDVPITGSSNSWGQIPSKGFHTIMGTDGGATWLLYGTSGGIFRYGIQGLDAGNALRFYSGTDYMTFAASGLNVNGLALAFTNQTMFIGTTPVTINRASGAMTLTGVSIDSLSGVGLASLSTGSTWPVIPRVHTDGVMEIGKYLDFHDVSNDSADYSTRLTSGANSLTCSGTFSATKVYNAVYNDIADFLELDEALATIEYGRCYVMGDDADEGSVRLSYKVGERGVIGIASDTFGYGLGRKDIGNRELPIAIGGFVLAHCDRQYRVGTALTSGPNGTLTKAPVWLRLLYPERVVATFYRVPRGAKWNGVEAQGRCIVKIK